MTDSQEVFLCVLLGKPHQHQLTGAAGACVHTGAILLSADSLPPLPSHNVITPSNITDFNPHVKLSSLHICLYMFLSCFKKLL